MTTLQTSPDVPLGWKAVWNKEHEEWFYVNLETKVSTWTRPTAATSTSTTRSPPSEAHNGNGVTGTHVPDSSVADSLALERQILEEYSMADSIALPATKATGWSLKRNCRVFIKRYNKRDGVESAKATREIAALSGLSDPSIPPLHDWFDPADTYFLVMEDRDDEPLRKYIEGRGPLSQDLTKAVTTQLFAAVAQIFNAGIAHLRICDETLFIDATGQLTIKDFEYAHEYGKVKVDTMYAETDAKYGSDIYVAPEVFAMQTYNARKAVIWACGVALYYMVTGQTEKLSNLEHPIFEKTSPVASADMIPDVPSSPRRLSYGRRKSSLTGRKLSISQPPNIVTYPGTRFEVVNWVRDIVSKMLVINPLRRAELIEVCAKVPKEFHTKGSRPLMELAWLDYKEHVGPYAGFSNIPELDSSASSVFSGVSNISNPFASLIGKRRSSTKGASYNGFV